MNRARPRLRAAALTDLVRLVSTIAGKDSITALENPGLMRKIMRGFALPV